MAASMDDEERIINDTAKRLEEVMENTSEAQSIFYLDTTKFTRGGSPNVLVREHGRNEKKWDEAVVPDTFLDELKYDDDGIHISRYRVGSFLNKRILGPITINWETLLNLYSERKGSKSSSLSLQGTELYITEASFEELMRLKNLNGGRAPKPRPAF